MRLRFRRALMGSLVFLLLFPAVGLGQITDPSGLLRRWARLTLEEEVPLADALRALHRKGLGPEGLDTTAAAYHLIARISGRLGLTYGRSGDEAAYLEEEVSSVQIPGLDTNPFTEIKEAMAFADRMYQTVFGSG